MADGPVQTVRVQHGFGCAGGCATLLICFALLKQWGDFDRWREQNEGLSLGLLAAIVFGAAVVYFAYMKPQAEKRSELQSQQQRDQNDREWSERIEQKRERAAGSEPWDKVKPWDAPQVYAPREAPVPFAADTRACPECAETIKSAARSCRFCHYRFDDK